MHQLEFRRFSFTSLQSRQFNIYDSRISDLYSIHPYQKPGGIPGISVGIWSKGLSVFFSGGSVVGN
jgi:hypothetical protein